jgi:hypothetical protein
MEHLCVFNTLTDKKIIFKPTLNVKSPHSLYHVELSCNSSARINHHAKQGSGYLTTGYLVFGTFYNYISHALNI